MRTTSSQFLGKIHFILPLLLFAACNRSPKDDGTAPTSLFPQPQTIAANPEGGYAINPVTGDSIKPNILSSGDTLITGVPIPSRGKLIHPDSVAKPRVVKATSPQSLERHNTHPNRHKIPENLPTFPVDHSQLKTVKLGEGNKDFVLINSIGDTIPTGIPIPARGKTVKAIQPLPTKALPPAFKDALTNLQYFDVDQGMGSSYVSSILEDKSGNIWFGTLDRGVSKYDGESFVHFTEAAGLSDNNVRSILEDKSGNLWFGTEGGGVSKYDGESFVHFTEAAGLSNNDVRSILEDKSGNLWFGTQGGGVSKYNGESFAHFTEAAGLSNNRVRSILEDNNRNLYITTVKGLTQISPLPASPEGGEVFAIQVFGTQDGLKGLDFYHNSALIDSKNRAWWGSGKGLTMLDLNKFNPSAQIPQPLLKQLDINEQFLDYRNISDSLGNEIAFKSVQKFENYPLNLELPYHKNHLTFHFAAIDWAAPHKIRYSHRMLGLNDNWSNPTREAKADYRNLPYGTYTFQIRAIGASEVWSEPFEYTFTINPPWWYSWWAYTLYGLIFLAALRSFSLWREQKLRKEKEQLQQKVEERTGELKKKSEELEHSLEDLKSTQAQLIQSEKMASLGELTAGIAHEIQNPLNFVNNFSELNRELIVELKEELEKGNLEEVKLIATDIEGNEEKINHHGKRAGAIVKGMLEHSRTSSGEKIPTDINALCDEYLRLSYHGLSARDKTFNADYKTDFDPNLPKVNVVPQDIGRMLLNLINNAFQAVNERGKKGESGYKPEVSVETKLTTKNLTLITIRDNGPGIPDSIKEKIFQPFFTTKPTGSGTGLGLSLSYDIVKAHGGEIRVESKQGEGTSFIISLPFKINQ